MIKKIFLGILIVTLVVFGINFFNESDSFSSENATELAQKWIENNSPTFNERGGSNLEHIETANLDEGFEVIFDFEANFSGYGSVDEDEMNAQVITPHTTRVLISGEEVTGVVTDQVFDEMSGSMIEGEGGEENQERGNPEEVAISLYYAEVVEGMEELVGVDRTIISTESNLPFKTLEALLEGPTESEKEEGYFSAIPEEAKVLSLEIEDGTATALFNPEFNEVAGSATVTIIRDQVEETLFQHEGIEEVLIEVEGVDSAEVLQP
jgi:spore germination protein GerM